MVDSNSLLVDASGNLKLVDIFVNSWFFGFIDFAFIFVLLASVFLLNRYGYRFGQIVGLVFGLALVFATISGSLVMWGVVVFIVVISALRFAINILLRV
jgi:hypothetical protein